MHGLTHRLNGIRRHHLFGNAPHFGKAPIGGKNLFVRADDQNAVRRNLELRRNQCRLERLPFLRALALGNIFRNAEQIYRFAVRALYRHFGGPQPTLRAVRSLNRFFGNNERLPAVESLAVFGGKKVGFFGWEKVIITFAQKFLARMARNFFAGLVPTHKA
ncbi:MAG: hypothetical protein HDKAJFGB_02796 [Anaerolineae bacterium]|nr:hypothetical protein [Anaerolineae bacterium]